MRASVDSDRCQGHARCWEICPEVFVLDDQGYATVPEPDVPVALLDKAAEAERNCPERAISIR